MTHKQHRPPFHGHIAHLPQALLLERRIPHRQHLVHQQDLRVQVGGHREDQAHVHAAGNGQALRPAPTTGVSPIAAFGLPIIVPAFSATDWTDFHGLFLLFLIRAIRVIRGRESTGTSRRVSWRCWALPMERLLNRISCDL